MHFPQRLNIQRFGGIDCWLFAVQRMQLFVEKFHVYSDWFHLAMSGEHALLILFKVCTQLYWGVSLPIVFGPDDIAVFDHI